MFLILHKSRVCFVSSQVIDQWSYFNQNKSIVTSIMIRYSSLLPFPSICAMAQCFLQGFWYVLINLDLCCSHCSRLERVGLAPPVLRKDMAWRCATRSPALWSQNFVQRKPGWELLFVQKDLSIYIYIYTLLTLKDMKGLVPFPWHIKELRAAGISAVEPFCLDVCFGWEMATW